MYTLYVCTFPRCSMNAICIFTDMIIGPPKWSHERIPTSRHPKTRLAKAYAEAARVRSEDFFCTGGGGGVWVVWNIIPEIWVSNIPNNSHIFQAGVTFFNPSFWVSMIFSTVKHHDFQEMIRYSFTETNILNIGHPKRKRSSSNHPFSGAMLVSVRVMFVVMWNDGNGEYMYIYIYIHDFQTCWTCLTICHSFLKTTLCHTLMFTLNKSTNEIPFFVCFYYRCVQPYFCRFCHKRSLYRWKANWDKKQVGWFRYAFWDDLQ